MTGPYDEMIDMPHPVSKLRPQMPMEKRAAQFSSFAALTGYEEGIKEAARLTDRRMELDEGDIAVLNMKLQMMAERIAQQPKAVITYFQPDAKKDGGAYVSAVGTIKKIDEYEKCIYFTDHRTVAMKDVVEIECEIFEAFSDVLDV